MGITTELPKQAETELFMRQIFAEQELHVPHIDFEVGEIRLSKGVTQLASDQKIYPQFFLYRHFRRDWGDVGEDGKRANDEAVENGSKILSIYDMPVGEEEKLTICVVTEAEVPAQSFVKAHRSHTLVMTQEELDGRK